MICGDTHVGMATATAILPTINLHHYRPTAAWWSIEQLRERNEQQQQQQHYPFHHYERRLQDTTTERSASNELSSLDRQVEENAQTQQEESSSTMSSTSNTPPSSDSPVEQDTAPTFYNLDDSSSSVQNVTLPSRNSTGRYLSWLSMVTLVTVLAMVVFGGLIMYRKHEIQRWNEYRTHFLLAAQDEAFDWSCLATEEDEDIDDFDLESPSSSMK
jgi:hypothetical protein